MAMSAQSIDWKSEVKEIVERHGGKPEYLLDILHEVQAKVNYLPQEALLEVARELDIPLSKVHGVATFYSMYSIQPRGQFIIRVCESAPCHVMGCDAVIAALESAAGARMGETTSDGLFTLEYTSCIGVCGVAPAIMINDRVYGNLTPESVVEIIAEYRARERGE